MKVPFVDLQWQEQQIRGAREPRFADVIARTAFIGGREVKEFEERFATYCATRHAIGVANGTDALALIYKALEIGAGDEVITIPTTFIASVSPLIHLGVRPVFVDIDPHTRNFNLQALEAAITPQTKAILAVHLYGEMADIDPIVAIAKKHNIYIIEDACQAHGATYKGAKAGSFGIAAAFSFYPGKNLGAYGDGGAVTTNDENLAFNIRQLANHGGLKKYEHSVAGFNSRLDTLQAVVLDEKLKQLDVWNDMRRAVADIYQRELRAIDGLVLPPVQDNTKPVHHLFVVEVPQGQRDAFMQYLKDKDIHTGIHYPTPLHLTGALASLGYKNEDFPIAERYTECIVSLPMFPGMTEAQALYVTAVIKEYFHA